MEGVSTKFAEDCLRLHNRYRAVHDSPPLRIEETLNEHAQELANNLAGKPSTGAEPLQSYGVNVYVTYAGEPGRRLRAREPIESWYREGRYYRYGVATPGNLEDVRNFAQLVWRETKAMGTGIASGMDGKIYLVCNYEPAGNIAGEFAGNVSPPKEPELEPIPLEETGIMFIEPKTDVVRSMERLYAVPSEQLRVWSVWLRKIGGMAEEWRYWLHRNIVLLAMLADRFQEARKVAAMGPDDEGVEPAMPRTVEEMLRFITEFTHRATVYRSRYNHWKETASRATKEITGRTVLTTLEVRGFDLQAFRQSAEAKTSEMSTESEEKFYSARNTFESVPEDDPERTSASSYPPQSAGKDSAAGSRRERGDVEDRMRDEARADEDLPYFFYLDAEPEVGIAMEHGDEEVVPPEPGRESVSADCKRLYFNLTEKPGQGGKPWL